MERFGLTLPLQNQYFFFRVGQNFSEKGGKTVTSPEACLLDWPITDLGREQALEGAKSFLEMRGLVWPTWRRVNQLSGLSGNQGGREAARKLKRQVLVMWAKVTAQSKQGGAAKNSDKKEMTAKERDMQAPSDIEVYSSDFKAAKQVATVATEWWAKDGNISAVNLHYTEHLRERSLGLAVESGGFDGCGRDELGQIWALDNLDGSHRLGGIESCEQVLSRCMRVILDIEAATRQKQVVLISHCDLLHIFQTIFGGQKPGAHRLLPLMDPGEVREIKFSAGGGDEEGEGEGDDVNARSFRVFLSSSVGLDRHRDQVIADAFPKIADECARRYVAFTYVDMRLSIQDEAGLGADTVANHLRTLEGSNAYVCLVDAAQEVYAAIDDQKVATLTRDELARKVAETLDEGIGGPVQQFLGLYKVLKEMVDALSARVSEAEQIRLAVDRPGMIRRDVLAACAEVADAAVNTLYASMTGLKAVVDLYDYLREWLEEIQGKRMSCEDQVEGMAKRIAEMTAEYEEQALKAWIKGLLGLAMKKVEKGTLDDYRAVVEVLKKKSDAIRKANEKYPWVGRWSESSLTEIEVRYASLSSVPAVEKAMSFYFEFESAKRRGTVASSRPTTTAPGLEGDGDPLAETGGTKNKTVEVHRSLLDALAAEGIVPAKYSTPAQVVDMIVEEFMFLLDSMFPVDQVPISLAHETYFHTDIAKERGELYVPESQLTRAVMAHANADVRQLQDMGVYMSAENMCNAMVVVGEPGSGKSALLAYSGLQHKRTSSEDIVVMHFSGSCFDATDPVRMMQRFILEMLGSQSVSRLGVNLRDARHVATQFMRAMEVMHFRYQGKRNVVLLIDSVDLLSEVDTNIDLWLPHVFPTTVRIILSTRDGTTFDSLTSRGSPSVRIPTLRPEARTAICASYLARIGRVFSAEQMGTAVGAPFTCSPLFLTGLAQQCRLCYSRQLDEFTSAEPIIKELDRSRDFKELYGNMLAELDVQYGGGPERGYSDMVRTVLTLLWASRKGLQEFELFEAMQQVCPAPYERLLVLLQELKQRVVLTQGRLRLFHQQFVLAVEKRYLGKHFEDDLTDIMVDSHLQLSRYFVSLPATYIRKVEEYPYQLCYCVASYPQERDELEAYILQTEVFREMADIRFHSDLVGYWRLICSISPGSQTEIAGKYLGSFQDYVCTTGDKGSIPELCFAVGFLLEDLGQYRSAKRVFHEAIRVTQNLSLMHPLVLSSLGNNLPAQLFELKPKILLHLGSSLLKAGHLGEARDVLKECCDLVESVAQHSWARADTQLQLGILAAELGNFAQAERTFKTALQCCEPADLQMQDAILEHLMELYRGSGMVSLQKGDHRNALKMLNKEHETIKKSRKLWTQYTYLDPASSRPPSAIVSLIESSKSANMATFSHFRCSLGYEPQIANQATDLTVSFSWNRLIEEGDDLSVQLKQLRAGGDRPELEAQGPFADYFTFSWVELTRTLLFVCKRVISPSTPVSFTIPKSERLRLPVKQAGDNRVLLVDAKVNVIKSRIRIERALGEHLSSRPNTGAGSRPGTQGGSRGGSRPVSRAGLKDFLLPGDEDEGESGMEKGSQDVARLDSRLGEVLGIKTLVLAVKHNEMLGYRNSWIKARHSAQLEAVEWHMRYAYDDNMKLQLLERLDKRQVNESDEAHLAYDRILRGERLAVLEMAERAIEAAIKMQEYLFGESHPMVTDTMMTSVRMYISRSNLVPALALLERVWQARTSPTTAERLSIGHPREKECSMYHMGITQWLSGNFKAACVILETLLKRPEKNVRDQDRVWSVLTLCHLSGCTSEERIMLAGQCVPWLKIVRPVDLNGIRLSSSDVLDRDQALLPPTTMPAWATVGQCLRVNKLIHVLDVSNSAMGVLGMKQVCQGICLNKSLSTLNLSGNNIGVDGSVYIQAILRQNAVLTDLDLSNNNLEDAGMRAVAEGIAMGSNCYNTTLRRLNLRNNMISPDGVLTISLALKFKKVRVANIDLSENPIYNVGITHIFDALFMGAPFVTMTLQDCQFGLEGCIKISEAVAVSDTLKVLDVSNHYRDEVGNYSLGNKIDSTGAQILADAVANTHSLTTLDVSGNDIGEKGAVSLCQILMPCLVYHSIPSAERGFEGVLEQWNAREAERQRGSKGALRSLKMRGCNIGPQGASIIAKDLARNPALVGLDLCQSGIQGTGVASIAVALGANMLYIPQPNTTITSLNLQCCEAFAAGAKHVASMMRSNMFLKILVLNDNNIGVEGGTAIAEALKENQSIAELRLAKNALGDHGVMALRESLATNRRLSILDLSLNEIGDAGMTAVARGLSRNPSLSVLDLKQNRFSAEGGWWLSLAGKTRPIHQVTRGGGALKILGLMPEDEIRSMLPRILSIDRCKALMAMRAVT